MAIDLDATSNSGEQSDNPFSWNHTCTGNNLILVVGVVCDDPGDGTVSGITYNGVSLTLIRRVEDDNNDEYISLWYLVNPATGTNSVEVTMSPGGSFNAVGMAISLTGASQTGQPDASNENFGEVSFGGGNQPSVDVTTVEDNSWVIDFVLVFRDTNIAAGAGQTQNAEVIFGDADNNVCGSSREGPKSPAGSVTMSWSGGGTFDDWLIGAVSIKEAAEAAAGGEEWPTFMRRGFMNPRIGQG